MEKSRKHAVFNYMTEIVANLIFKEIGHSLKSMSRYKNPLDIWYSHAAS